MKRFLTIAILLLPALFACNKNSDGNDVATGVTLSTDRLDLLVGQTATLTATVLPESLKMGVVWSVIDETYAEVNDGVVTAKAEGVTYVVATSADGNGKASCMISVNPELQYSVSIKDETGLLVTSIYGYPGLTKTLRATTSDGEPHIFTWSLDDESAGTITSNGVLTLGATESTNASFIYDAQTSLKVVTEDGCGCKIPVRSSLLAGLEVGGVFNPVGTPIIVQASEAYPVAILCQGELGTVEIPVDAVSYELSNNDDFTIAKEDGGFVLTTGPETGVSTSVNIGLPGLEEKVEIAQLKIDKVYGITAQFAGASSSTLTFTWTEGGSAEEDIAKPYTISLYKDEECTDLEVSFSIPAGDGCWNARQPKFVLSGLTPETQYWFQVLDTTPDAEKDSPVIPATTLAFDNILVPSDPAEVGDIILAEDFGQLCWGADELTQAAGYDVASASTAYDSNVASSFLTREAERFVGTTDQYAQRSLTASSAKKEAGFRLAHWAIGYYARAYVGPGYLFLSTYKYCTHIITPKLECIPEGTIAKLKVTVHAAGKTSGGKAVLAVQHGTSFSEISSNTQTNKDKLNLTSNVESITFSGGLTNLEEFEVTIEGVVKGDRIAFGPEVEKKETNSNMMLISDMTIQILELQ